MTEQTKQQVWGCEGGLKDRIRDLQFQQEMEENASTPPQADAETLPDGELKMFPLCGCAGSIPYVLAEEAYAAYSKKYGSQQTLTRMGERGGFYAEELDEFIPGWRDRAIAIKLQYEASVARIAADSVLVPRAELERLRDAERIAWLFETCHNAPLGDINFEITARGRFRHFHMPGAFYVELPVVDGKMQMSDAARAIIDAAREGKESTNG